MLGLSVTPASVQDRDGCLPLLRQVRRLFVFLKRLFADGSYSGVETAAAVKRIGKMGLEVVTRSDQARGFVVLAKRWIVERTFGWLGRCRRLAKDFEHLTRTQIAFVQLAMIRLMMRRIARASNPKRKTRTDSNEITHMMPFWDLCFAALSADYLSVKTDRFHIDILTAQFVQHRGRSNVVVASNLFDNTRSPRSACRRDPTSLCRGSSARP